MLSRVADSLFWTARYVERAENTARMLDAAMQRSLVPQTAAALEQDWRAILRLSELEPAFLQAHARVTPEAVLDFMVRAPGNASSILACLRAARENARAVRGALPAESWETHNATWLDIQRLLADGLLERDPSAFFEWVKFRSHLSRGVTLGTMLRDEAFHFMRMGTFLERADNTARLLDVRFHAGDRQSRADFHHWVALLRSCSALQIYRKTYRDVIHPERVAELLVLDAAMPRSLALSVAELHDNLAQVAAGRAGDADVAETLRQLGQLRAELGYARIDDILAAGLHAWLTRFLGRINAIGARIADDFLVPLAA